MNDYEPTPPPVPPAPQGPPVPPQPYGEPYGEPGQAYGQPGQPPYGQQGQWPPPIPDRRGGKGKAIGIGVGALAVVGALVGGALYFTGGDDDGRGAYTIELPPALVDGEYKKQAPDADDEGVKSLDAEDRAEMKKLGLEGVDGDHVGYKNDKNQGLQVVGMYGKIPDPAKSVDKMIRNMAESDKDNEDGTPTSDWLKRGEYKDYRPSGFDGAVLKCKQDTMSFSIVEKKFSQVMSQCIWGDKGAVGLVMSHSMGGSEDMQKTNGLTAEKLAEVTAKIRKEVRKPR
ncbi:hypothetical protein [Streptomyces sp. NPDC008001]|uniref:hypothetical protein n=1 Tax=Streptomyces sp. NPDC008001 TaxID=3364804 RepID=UPI0036E0A137